MNEVTRIINAIEQGEAGAAEKLLPLVYEELRLLAAKKMAQEKPGQTLQATALVHEAYLRLIGSDDRDWDNRGHFFAAAAEAMRRILIEQARRKRSQKHGGHLHRMDSDNSEPSVDDLSEDVVAVDEALAKFAVESPERAELVKLCYFGGLSVEQAARVMKISRATAYRYWSYARAWLYDEIKRG